jgi:two-component system sensor histidine kinase KdpD
MNRDAEHRPEPDALLRRLAAEEGGPRAGRLKVFLGAAPGVGKTYAMLAAAGELRRQGLDVVVGVVETHGRAETAALLDGLEVLPRRSLEYKGRDLEELDLDGLLKRRPKIALIDELAHTNVPGSRHQRRYQDVEELLEAGIDVFATLNVQHFESLNDVVEQITGVRVRETVPDAFLDRMRDVVLVDLPPGELIERLRQGKVYVPDRARAALDRFFQPSNLAALRELAMHAAADRVDADLRESLRALGGPAVPALGRRVLVAVDGHEHTEYLVRMTRRFAERRQAPWTVVFVETGSARTDRAALARALELARRLGGETAILRGVQVVDEILDYATRHGVGSVLIGRTRDRPWARFFGRTITQRLLDRGARFELTIVNTPYARRRSRRWLSGERSSAERWSAASREFGLATAAIGIASGIAALLDRWLPTASLGMVLLCGVVVVAVRARPAAAAYATVVGALSYNFFFTDPRFTLRIASAHDVVAVATFLLAGLVCGRLAARQRGQVVMLRAANEHTRAVQMLGERLSATTDMDQVLQAGAEGIAAALGCEAAIWRSSTPPSSGIALAAAQPPTAEISANDLAAADWVASHGQAAGRFTATLTGSPWWLLPLGEDPPHGAVGLRFPAAVERLTDEQRILASALAQQVAIAVERVLLAAALERTRIEGESDRLRTALLSSVSHDLRSPLSAVIGAASTLSAFGETMPSDDRRQLLDSIRGEGERLDRYIQNLLDMTRLGAGTVKLERDWVSLDELLGSAIQRLRRISPEVEVRLHLAADLPLLSAHGALLEQAFFNVLENAAKFSPPGAPIDVTAARSADDARQLLLDFVDRGPGIPEAERRRVFDMFHSVERGDRGGGGRGSGLGLTIVRGMVGAHGGRVEAIEGTAGRGTRIRITLPLHEPPRGEP